MKISLNNSFGTILLVIFLALSLISFSSNYSYASLKSRSGIVGNDTTSASKLSPYEKLFYKKNVKTSKGFINLHLIGDKIYFELPLNLIGKDLLMSSVVDNVSNMSLSYVGQRTSRPSHVCFTKSDSLIQLNIVPLTRIVDSNDTGIKTAVNKSSLPRVIGSSSILAYNQDSSAVVFDATSFFLSGDKHIGTLNASSYGGFIQRLSTYSKDLSMVKDIEAFDDNVSVINNMTYSLKTYFLGIESQELDYLTIELKTTLSKLPEEEFHYREADYRIGTEVTAFEKFDSKEQGTKKCYFSNRWRIEPEDVEKYLKGELVLPKKPIIVYVDTLFFPSWREAVKKGLLKWNQAFERIGYKDVIQVFDYPSKSVDPKFSPSNISYNCVKYAQIPSRNITRQINIDPRSGEILSASILFFKDSPVTLQRERLYQTAAVEPEVRSYELPDDLMCSAIEMAMTREMGFCLGLSANLASSSWMPVDSLRSPTFTSREGISSSVMDQIKYNYVAQPGDIERGVKLTLDDLGVYDYYAIEWLYKPFFDTVNYSDENKLLRKIIADKSDDPRYYYGKEQNGSAYFDPRSLVEDLGNDKIQAAKYGINTLKYVAENGTEWVNYDFVDESYRELFVDFIFLKLYDYYRSLMVNIGGIEINNKYEGDKSPTYVPVDRATQKATLKYMMEQADDLKWLDNKDLLRLSGMNGSFSDYFANNLITMIFQRIPMVVFSQDKTTPSNAYSLDEMLGDITDFALKNISKGYNPTEAQTATLFLVTQLMLQNSSLPNVIEAKAQNKNAFHLVSEDNPYSYSNLMARCYPDVITDIESERSGFETLVELKYLVNKNMSSIYYNNLKDLRDKLKKYRSRINSETTRSKIDYLILAIDKGIGKENI